MGCIIWQAYRVHNTMCVLMRAERDKDENDKNHLEIEEGESVVQTTKTDVTAI